VVAEESTELGATSQQGWKLLNLESEECIELGAASQRGQKLRSHCEAALSED
jgi:hypothetical protein